MEETVNLRNYSNNTFAFSSFILGSNDYAMTVPRTDDITLQLNRQLRIAVKSCIKYRRNSFFYFFLVVCVNVAHRSRTERTTEVVAYKRVYDRVIYGEGKRPIGERVVVGRGRAESTEREVCMSHSESRTRR